MKLIATLTLAVALASTGVAFAESGNMKGMQMDSRSHGEMKGMDMDKMGKQDAKKGEIHSTEATVKKVDPAKGTVTLAHGPVKSLKWPAMTMGFSVKDKTLFDKLKAGEKVEVEFVQKGKEYVVTSVK